ncbi:Hypothetical predicted protein [Octopus vulgaris]|uniref:Secreted protein n=1 Tax=Octopus vulgaris TaxID=6645 RepID=A0AA36B3E4_OCTVU|nr:Hypothetical predicted protein [Octopus vulgaris]
MQKLRWFVMLVSLTYADIVTVVIVDHQHGHKLTLATISYEANICQVFRKLLLVQQQNCAPRHTDEVLARIYLSFWFAAADIGSIQHCRYCGSRV